MEFVNIQLKNIKNWCQNAVLSITQKLAKILKGLKVGGGFPAKILCFQQLSYNVSVYLYPRYEVYRGYIVFAFSVIMFVCLFVCKLFFRQRFLSNYLG